MSFVVDRIRELSHSRPGSEGDVASDISQFHEHTPSAFPCGVFNRLCSPSERLLELQGTDSIEAMADKCHIKPEDLRALMACENIDPTAMQLMGISVAYSTSVLWLLGFHAEMSSVFSADDKKLLDAISKRDSAEQALKKARSRSFVDSVVRQIAQRRVRKAETAVQELICKLQFEQRLPLSENDLQLLQGRPIFVERDGNPGEWGFVTADCIQTPSAVLDFEGCEFDFTAFLSPAPPAALVE